MNFLLGLSQNYQKAHGFGHYQKTPRVELLLFSPRMYSRLQYNVYKLLRLQQTRGRCSGNGANIRKIISKSGKNINYCTQMLHYAIFIFV